jgi:hypothetical protein
MSEYMNVDLRQMLKDGIDTWPEQMFVSIFDFALFEGQRYKVPVIKASAPDLKRREAGYERLKKYFGTIDREINWKEELYEALDEKYNSAT